MYQPTGLRLNILGSLLCSSLGLRLAIRVLYRVAIVLAFFKRAVKRIAWNRLP